MKIGDIEEMAGNHEGRNDQLGKSDMDQGIEYLRGSALFLMKKITQS